MTQAVYRFEDLFKKLTGHLHWMWWPMIGGLLIGVGGLIDPRALGVGYDTIHAELLGQLAVGALALLLVVKLVIWSGALGGGTSGGILAPIMMMGAAIGGILGHVLPGTTPGVWALLGLAGAHRPGSPAHPFTAIVFAFELTHDQNSLLALLVAATVAHLVSVLVSKRSILTEKVARRGFHVMREYAVDPLEATFVREVMDTDIYTLDPDRPWPTSTGRCPEGSPQRRQRLYPVIDADGRTRRRPALVDASSPAEDQPDTPVRDAMITSLTVAHPDEILRAVADRMAALGLGVLPVVDRAQPAAPRRTHHPLRPPPSPPEAPRRRTTRRAGPDTSDAWPPAATTPPTSTWMARASFEIPPRPIATKDVSAKPVARRSRHSRWFLHHQGPVYDTPRGGEPCFPQSGRWGRPRLP